MSQSVSIAVPSNRAKLAKEATAILKAGKPANPAPIVAKAPAKAEAKAPAKAEAKAPAGKAKLAAKAKAQPVTAYATALNDQLTTGGRVYVTYLYHMNTIDGVKNSAAKVRELMAAVNPVFNDGKYKDATIGFYLSVANVLQSILKIVDTMSYEKALAACSNATNAMSVTLVYHLQSITSAKDSVGAMRAIMAKSKSKWGAEAATIKASSMSTVITDRSKFLQLANAWINQ